MLIRNFEDIKELTMNERFKIREEKDYSNGIENINEFNEFERLKDEIIEKNPERTKEVLMDFCYMCYRNNLFSAVDINSIFYDEEISWTDFLKKYNCNETK